MSETNLPAVIDDATMFHLVANGDLSKLSAKQKLSYYLARCDAAGLDPRTHPFQIIKLQGREVLYALKGCTDQLAAKHGVVVQVVDQRTENGVRTVTVRAVTRDGRQTDEIGCVTVANLQGDNLCNAYMKAITKAKRRAILSVCGLGMTDETEVETIPGAQPAEPILIAEPKRKSENGGEPKPADWTAPHPEPDPPPAPEEGYIEDPPPDAPSPVADGDAPADDAPSGLPVYRGGFKDPASKPCKNGARKFMLMGDDGHVYHTFSPEAAGYAKEQGFAGPYLVEYEDKGKFGREIVQIVKDDKGSEIPF